MHSKYVTKSNVYVLINVSLYKCLSFGKQFVSVFLFFLSQLCLAFLPGSKSFALLSKCQKLSEIIFYSSNPSHFWIQYAREIVPIGAALLTVFPQISMNFIFPKYVSMQVWNDAMHVLNFFFWGVDLNTKAYHVDRYSLYLLLLKSSMFYLQVGKLRLPILYINLKHPSLNHSTFKR